MLNDANVDIWILTNLYDTLLQPTDDGKGVQPGLATEWKVADDGMSFTLTLRQGIKFADGSPITAEDVKWSLDRARNPKNGIWNFLVASIDSVEIKDATAHRPDAVKHPDPTHPGGARHLQHGDPAAEATSRRPPGATDAEKAQGLRRASDRLRPLHVRQLAARLDHGAGQAQSLTTGSRARTASRCPISTRSSSRSSPTTRPGS